MSEASHYDDYGKGRVHEDEEYEDVTFEVTLTLRADDALPREQDIVKALYRGLPELDSEAAVQVVRQ